MSRTAIFPGSFDPFTRGHEALVESALTIFDRVIIGIGHNSTKRGMLSEENRKRLIEDIYMDNDYVEVEIYSGLTGDFAIEHGATSIIRGVRNSSDFEYEQSMEATNRRLYPEITTIMLFTPSDVSDISSSIVREIFAFGRSVDVFMPEKIDIKNYL